MKRILLALAMLVGLFLIPSGTAHATPSRPALATSAGSSLLCTYGLGLWSDSAHLYATEEQLYPGGTQYEMRARSSVYGPWQNFAFCLDAFTGYWSIWSESTGLWVTAEVGDLGANYGMLRARSTTIGPWQLFTMTCQTYVDTHGGLENTGSFALRSAANGEFVTEEQGYTGESQNMLRAARSTWGPWETWEIRPTIGTTQTPCEGTISL